MAARRGRILTALLGWAAAVAVALVALASHLEIARHKPFHVDEGLEWSTNCAQPALELVRDGAAHQCSPSPLYYLALKQLARVVEPRDDRILVAYRTLSLASVAVLLALTGGWLGTRLGVPCALVGVSSLLSQPFLHDYATQSRPYALALLLFAALLLACADALANVVPPPRGASVAAAVLAVAGSLVLLTGAAQSAAACVAFLVLARLQGVPFGSPVMRVAALALAGCVVAGAYYRSLSVCLAYGSGPLSVWGSQGPLLVRHVVDLLWTDGIWGNALLLAGCAAPFRVWGERTRSRAAGLAWALGLMLLIQLGLTLLLGAAFAWSDYYFLPRLFLHLMVCRAFLVALGVWAVTQEVVRLRSALRPVVEAVGAALGLALLGLALSTLRADAAERRAAAGATPAPSCLPWALPLHIAAGEPDDLAFGPNTIAEASREARRCGASLAGEPRVLLTRPDGVREIVETPPAGARLLRQCGRVVTLQPGDGR